MRTRTVVLVSAALVMIVTRFGIAQQQTASVHSTHAPTAADEPAVGNAADYEVLRRLLGVPSLTPAAPPQGETADDRADESDSRTASVDPAPVVAEKPAQPRAAKPAPVTRQAAVPVKKAASKPPRREINAVAAMDSKASPAAQGNPKEIAQENSAEKPVEVASLGSFPAGAPVSAPETSVDLPQAGTVIRAAELERWEHLLGPSVQWTLLRGAKIRVGERKPIRMEDARAAATERYHDQVQLTPGRKDMRNFVAGIPFPFVQSSDADAAVKIIFNQQSRMIVDDVDARKMGCHLASISNRGLEMERTFQIEHWRRLFYVGRLYHQPLPTWNNREGIRYRELQYPLIEPFDLKGGGWNYIRYQDVAKPDDGWLYYPVMRRIRRISTAQRSQGFFGQDMDLDSFAGYAGNPAWMQWKLVGQKTMLASMHSDHMPVKWQAPPADFAADEPWEPREVYVIEGRSLLPEYAFARRVVYVDKESWLIAYSEIYDNQGKLWKALHQNWGFASKVRADAGGKSFEEFYLPGYAMIDMQIDHITRCELPLDTAVGDKGWYYNYGDAEGTTENSFDIAGMIGESH